MTDPTDPTDPNDPTDPPGSRRHRRHRRHRSSGTPDRVSRRARALLALGAILGIAFAAIAVAFVLGGGLAGPSPSSGTPGTADGLGSDFPGLVTPAPGGSPEFSLPPIATGSPSAGSVPSGSPAPGIRAKRIRIDRLGIDLPVVEGDGIDAPIGKAAHYPGSAWPGGGSNIYIYGHARVGMFLALWQVAVGDEVVLDLVDGTERTYVVREILPKVAWDAVNYLAATPTEQLTLQTSTSYHPTSPRFVAIAFPKP